MRAFKHAAAIASALERCYKFDVRFLLLLMCIALFAPTGCLRGEPTAAVANYGVKVKYAKGVALRFKDFSVTPLGSHHVTPPQFPRGWDVYEFRVDGGGEKQVVTWSSGTGLLGPTRFKFGGREFDLELRHHDKLGWLKEDKIVVTPVP